MLAARILWDAVVGIPMASSHYTHQECLDALSKFSPSEVPEFSAIDKAIARLRLLPYYRAVCPRFTDEWDLAERRLD